MKYVVLKVMLICLLLSLAGCSTDKKAGKGKDVRTDQEGEMVYQEENTDYMQAEKSEGKPYTVDTEISEVIRELSFGDYGRLIFPADSGYYSGDTLGTLTLTWYSNIDSEKTVEIANYMKDHAAMGETIFYDIYTDEEKENEPDKKDTGLFFFKGSPGEKFAVCNAGGGFAYVGAMQDSFPHALELSKKVYNAFALIYRPGAQTACEDLARAVSFIFEHAKELEVDTGGYSLWGGSAGARMAAFGIPTEFHKYPGLGHGFGLGTGTAAEGWIEDAVTFWETQTK